MWLYHGQHDIKHLISSLSTSQKLWIGSQNFTAPSPETQESEAQESLRTPGLASQRALPLGKKEAVASVVWPMKGGNCSGSLASWIPSLLNLGGVISIVVLKQKPCFQVLRSLPTNGKKVVVQSLSCVALCDLMDCSTPGFPVLHHLPEFAQTRVPWVGDAIQPSHPLSRRDQFTHLLSSSFRSTYYFRRESQLSQYLWRVESNGVQPFRILDLEHFLNPDGNGEMVSAYPVVTAWRTCPGISADMHPVSPPCHHQQWELHCPYSKDEKSEVLEVTSMVRPEDCRSQPLKGRSWRWRDYGKLRNASEDISITQCARGS